MRVGKAGIAKYKSEIILQKHELVRRAIFTFNINLQIYGVFDVFISFSIRNLNDFNKLSEM